MQTRRQIAMMSALNEEQTAILDGFRNLPVHAGVFAARYQKAAQDENLRKLHQHSEEIGSLRSDFAATLAQQTNGLRQELTTVMTTSSNKLTEAWKKDQLAIQIRIDTIEQDVLTLKKPKKETSWIEFFFVAFGVYFAISYLYSPPMQVTIGQ